MIFYKKGIRKFQAGGVIPKYQDGTWKVASSDLTLPDGQVVKKGQRYRSSTTGGGTIDRTPGKGSTGTPKFEYQPSQWDEVKREKSVYLNVGDHGGISKPGWYKVHPTNPNIVVPGVAPTPEQETSYEVLGEQPKTPQLDLNADSGYFMRMPSQQSTGVRGATNFAYTRGKDGNIVQNSMSNASLPPASDAFVKLGYTLNPKAKYANRMKPIDTSKVIQQNNAGYYPLTIGEAQKLGLQGNWTPQRKFGGLLYKTGGIMGGGSKGK